MYATGRQKIKLLLTSVMSALSVILFLIFPSVLKGICIFAMLFSSVGDVIMMDFKPLTRHIKKDIFTYGMLSFGIAHILYIILYLLKAISLNVSVNIGTYIAIGITVFTILALLVTNSTKRILPASFLALGILYILILSSNLCIVSTLAFSVRGNSFLTLIGAFSFYLSDMIIAFNKAANKSGGEIPIWIFYVTGQVFLIIGA